MKTVLESKLEQAQTDLALSVKTGEAEVERIKAKIADESKPLKRSGDCCLAGGYEPAIIIGNGTDSHVLYKAGHTGYHGAARHVYACNPIFNAFDDLKALQKNVTGFEMSDADGDKVKACKSSRYDRGIHIKTSSSGVTLTAKEVARLVLKLRQMEYTLKQEKRV